MTLPDAKTPILVVDDSKAIRATMEAYLQRLGYMDVELAETVGDGLRLFREQGSDVVFLDVMIGTENAEAFAKQALEERPFTRIVLLTALASDDPLVTELVSLGARHMLSKPVQLSTLKTVMERLQQSADEERSLTVEEAKPPNTSQGYQ